MREIIIPGEELADSKDHFSGMGTYSDGKKIFSRIFGISDKSEKFVKVVPLKGKYLPVEGDHIIGIVEAVKFRGYFLDINSAYNAYLPSFDDNYKIGDILLVKVVDVDEIYHITADDARTLYDGKLIEIIPVKIPRIVGKKASMIDILRRATNCRIFVGRNGRIFIKGELKDVRKAEETIRLIEREAHTKGLTNRVKILLEGKPKAVKEEKPKAVKEEKPKAVKEAKPKVTKEEKPKKEEKKNPVKGNDVTNEVEEIIDDVESD